MTTSNTGARRAATLIVCAGLAVLAPAALANKASTANSAALGLEAAIAQPASEASTVTHASSLWRKDKYDVEGSYRIETTEAGTFIVLSRDFNTKEGPDLKLVLSPQTSDRVRARSALQGSLIVGELTSNRGEQRFRIPDGTDLSKYKSVLIHCEEFTVMWAAAPLHAGEIVARGHDWTKKANRIRGHWEIAQDDKGYVLRVAEDFNTRNAPDLKFVLSPHTTRAAKNDNALRGGTVIAELRSNKGAQTFRIPAGVNPADFNSLLIHCEQYTKLWGGSSI
ncbi:MAG: DM13 domain-containing protein [Planctomycetota bacterium]